VSLTRKVRPFDEIATHYTLMHPGVWPEVRQLLRWVLNTPNESFPDLTRMTGDDPVAVRAIVPARSGQPADLSELLSENGHANSHHALASTPRPAAYRPVPTVDELQASFESNLYFMDRPSVATIRQALVSGKGLLVGGPPGVGKTTVAAEIARACGLDPKHPAHFQTVFCTPDITAAEAIYRWNDAKRLMDQQLVAGYVQAAGADDLMGVYRELSNRTYSLRYLLIHPLLSACVVPFRTVRLLDELDKAAPWFDNELLHLLGFHQYPIPEAGAVGRERFDPEHGPLFVLTSNEEREISAPLASRCVPLFLDHPSEALEARILKAKTPLDTADCGRVAAFFRQLRENNKSLRLRVPPGTREVIDTGNALAEGGLPCTPAGIFSLNCLWVKNRGDHGIIARRYFSGNKWADAL
jgi:MoxR-like ATPase